MRLEIGKQQRGGVRHPQAGERTGPVGGAERGGRADDDRREQHDRGVEAEHRGHQGGQQEDAEQQPAPAGPADQRAAAANSRPGAHVGDTRIVKEDDHRQARTLLELPATSPVASTTGRRDAGQVLDRDRRQGTDHAETQRMPERCVVVAAASRPTSPRWPARQATRVAAATATACLLPPRQVEDGDDQQGRLSAARATASARTAVSLDHVSSTVLCTWSGAGSGRRRRAGDVGGVGEQCRGVGLGRVTGTCRRSPIGPVPAVSVHPGAEDAAEARSGPGEVGVGARGVPRCAPCRRGWR